METALIFSGIVVSLFIELLKKKFNLSGLGTMAVVTGLAAGGSVAFYFLQKYGFLESFLQIMTVAGAFYAFILKNIKDSQPVVVVSSPKKKKK